MPTFEYKVIPAPKKGQRTKGVRGTEARFANSLQMIMNQHGADGWEYLRTDTLPCEERSGLTGRTTVYQNMLVFRRDILEDVVSPVVAAPVVATPVVAAPVAAETSDGAIPTIETVMNDARAESRPAHVLRADDKSGDGVAAG